MAKLGKVKKHGFTMMNNTIADDPRLSWQAKGLMFYMCKLPDDWDFYKSQLAKVSTNGRDSTERAYKELQKYGYIVDNGRKHDSAGRFCGVDILLDDSPHHDYPQHGLPPEENQQLQNTDITNTDLTKEKIYKKESYPNFQPKNWEEFLKAMTIDQVKIWHKAIGNRVIDEDGCAMLAEWVKYRRKRRKPYTSHGLSKVAERMFDNPRHLVLASMQRSFENSRISFMYDSEITTENSLDCYRNYNSNEHYGYGSKYYFDADQKGKFFVIWFSYQEMKGYTVKRQDLDRWKVIYDTVAAKVVAERKRRGLDANVSERKVFAFLYLMYETFMEDEWRTKNKQWTMASFEKNIDQIFLLTKQNYDKN